MLSIVNGLRNPWIVIGLVAVLLIGGAMWYGSTASAKYDAGVEVKAHIKGNPDATVKLVEYSDFQCPACAQFQPVVAEIIAEYGDRMSFEYRHFPLTQIHRLAEPAARAAEAAGQQGKFFEFHDLLFVNQATWAQSTNPAQFFVQYATELGLDVDQFMRQQRSTILRDQVRAQFNEARDLGFTGTPSFVLNGQVMKFNSFDEFKAQIVAAIDPSIDLTPAVEVGGETTITPAVEATPEVKFGI
jgi:protein-disulfide isomerase